MEEAGVRLHDLDHIGRIWSIPTIVTERIDYFLAPYSDADRIAAGGGLAHEHENITVHELPLAELWARHEAKRLPDGKLVIALLALRMRRLEVFG